MIYDDDIRTHVMLGLEQLVLDTVAEKEMKQKTSPVPGGEESSEGHRTWQGRSRYFGFELMLNYIDLSISLNFIQ